MSHPNNDLYLDYVRDDFEQAELSGDVMRMEEIVARLKQDGFDAQDFEKRLRAINDAE